MITLYKYVILEFILRNVIFLDPDLTELYSVGVNKEVKGEDISCIGAIKGDESQQGALRLHLVNNAFYQ